MSVPNQVFLKAAGAFCVLIGLVEIGVGAEVWAFAPHNRYGSWWAAMVVVATGIVALIANNKVTLQVMTFLGTAASILTFSGMLVDSFGYRRVNALETCVNTETGAWTGASGMQPEAAVCATQTAKLCACVGGHDVCHFYDINPYRQQNCELILTRYTDLLLVSLIFTTFCLAWVFVLSVFGCVTIHKIDNPAKAPSTHQPVATSEPATSTGAVQMTLQSSEENPDSPL